MHLLAAKPGGFIDDEGIIDLNQTPADIVILSAQDTSLGLLAEHIDQLPETWPSVRLANFVNLTKPAAYDLYEHSVLQHASVIVVSLLGGESYWPYGVEQLTQLAKRKNIELVLIPGDDQPDPALIARSSCNADICERIWRYLRFGGKTNTAELFNFLFWQFFATVEFQSAERQPSQPGPAWQEPRPLPACIIYQSANNDHDNSGNDFATLAQWLRTKDNNKPTAVILFYRSHVQSGNTDAFDEFIAILEPQFNVLSLATLSLKDSECLSTVNHLLVQSGCNVVINTTSFSQHIEGNASMSSSPQLEPTRLFDVDVPVIQAILAANDREDWQQNLQGLRARDIAMNVALPEFDGRIISRAISFKQLVRRSERSQIDIIRYQLHPERGRFVAQLALAWAKLNTKSNKTKRIGLVLANYPTKDGRIGNGVGLDTPASVITLLDALKASNYSLSAVPENGDQLINALLTGVTNDLDSMALRPANQSLSKQDYLTFFSQLPEENQQAVMDRWGNVEDDPKFRQGRLMVSGIRFDHVFVGIQPARGFNVDVVANYHDPDLVPPHGYLAFYFWLRHEFAIDAITHVGKHGNLEWLPGKSIGLANTCWPDIALGPTPHLYPFIVNDPGEGAQAKRRAQAVILDHLMPPMARAESHGDMVELEKLVDEYYEAMGLDQRREVLLRTQILALLTNSHLIEEIGATEADVSNTEEILGAVDTYLCELKESQIRHGLHRFGQLPESERMAETLVALTRLPRGDQANDRGLLHCICADLALTNTDSDVFNPLDFDPGKPWLGNKPPLLQAVSSDPWRTQADTRERLEQYAEVIIDETISKTLEADYFPRHGLVQTEQLVQYIEQIILPAIVASAECETANFIRGLDGGFIPPGPSGAPTRGRLDVLPTGRNFYSLDARSIPTPTAWQLGQQSAEQLVLRHLQEQGDYPKQLGISVWGTSTMRTGGDDIAQAFALMGVRPLWATGSNRVTDIEIIPGFQLGRPRVDVTLRISGFFRDAFPNVARLFDTAVRALADYEEPGDSNTIRHHIEAEKKKLRGEGVNDDLAQHQATCRVFGSKPGSYGAGLQGLIDERVWNDASDLAKAYVNWGGYSYSNEQFGEPAFQVFEQRLSQLEAVVQNQDNREHDLLDSDDYYQFQGGMANAVEVLHGEQPQIYHGDHSNPASPKIKTLKEELNRVIRSRVTNPKWINAMQTHGYKGAFEMAASVDYLFAYDATTNLIDDYQYANVTDALLLDDDNQQFLQQANPNALKEMAERLLEAQQRGLWQQPGDYQNKITDIIVRIDNALESN